MHTIALVSRKGGTGKSTLTIGLALAAMEHGHTVHIIDADPLGTVSNWHRRRAEAEPKVESVHDGYALVQRVRGLAERGVTLTIIDTAGGWSDAWAGAVAAADLCLIPVRPSPADIEASAPTLSAIRAGGRPFAFVLSQTPARSARLTNAAASLTAATLNGMGVLALPYIVARNDQQDALGLGLSITEYARGGKSAEEVRKLWQWAWARLLALAPEKAGVGQNGDAQDMVTPPEAQPYLPVNVPVNLPAVIAPAAAAADLYAAG